MEPVSIPVNQVSFSRQLFKILKNDVFSHMPDATETQPEPEMQPEPAHRETQSRDSLDFHRTKVMEIKKARRHRDEAKLTRKPSSLRE